jgi:hypothetical protein
VVNQLDATIEINGSPVTSNQWSNLILLVVGDNFIEITVTAEDGVTSKNYNINIIRDLLSNNANLASLELSRGVLDSIFQPFIADYTATVDFIDANIQIIAVTDHRFASFSVNGGVSINSGDQSQLFGGVTLFL